MTEANGYPTYQVKHILATEEFVRERLRGAESGHDWWHILRVWNNAKLILKTEPEADGCVVELSALLHDIADSKFHGGNEYIGPEIAGSFLAELDVAPDVIQHVKDIILNMSFKASLGRVTFRSREMDIVQDADRLDAIGAIGIARAFAYGGFKNRALFDPEESPREFRDKEDYKNSASPTINHFYEKLLLLKDQMNTRSAREIAGSRHQYMLKYLEQFYGEWEGLR